MQIPDSPSTIVAITSRYKTIQNTGENITSCPHIGMMGVNTELRQLVIGCNADISLSRECERAADWVRLSH